MGKDNKKMSPVAAGAVGLASAFVGVVGGWIAYSRLKIDHNVPLPAAIMVPRTDFTSPRAGQLSTYIDRSAGGRPLVLLHSINAAASAYEVRPIFERYRGSRPVFALDLPGFGFSARTDRIYSVELYTNAILDFLSTHLDEPADVVALSLTSEFAARAALQAPERFHSLTMISPSGFGQREGMPATQRASEADATEKTYRFLSFPLWSQALYDALTTRAGIHFFLQMSFQGAVDYGLMEYDYKTSHQPGARYAPLYFVSGQLFTPDIRMAVYEVLETPTLVLYDDDAFVSFDTLPQVVERNHNWYAERIIPTKGLPHFEQMGQVAAALDAFWAGVDGATT